MPAREVLGLIVGQGAAVVLRIPDTTSGKAGWTCESSTCGDKFCPAIRSVEALSPRRAPL
jgi:hypothetical protein